jgi:GTPase
VLLHLVDGTAPDPVADWRTIVAELEAYGAGLAEKRRVLALNKVDALDEAELEAAQAALRDASGADVHLLSGATGQGVREVLRAIRREIEAARDTTASERSRA